MKKFLLLFAVCTAGLWAQNTANDPKIMEAFKATCARLAEHPYTTGNFEQEKTLSRLNRSLKSSGVFIIAAELGMVWDTIKPFPSTLTLGKDYMIQSRPGGNRTVLSAQGNETFIRMAEVISAVFSGQSKGLIDNFEINYTGTLNDWKLELSPKSKAIGSFAEKIIMKGDAVIQSILIYEQSGDSIEYILSQHRYPADLSANEKALFTLP